MTKHHNCGGTLLVSGTVGEEYIEYCDRCLAYRAIPAEQADDGQIFPRGHNRDANEEAFANGDPRSPDA